MNTAEEKKVVKFKSLIYGYLFSELEIMLGIDMMTIDDNEFSPDLISDYSLPIYFEQVYEDTCT
jgi:hypothetical protein